MRGINFQPSASACMNSGLYGEGDVRPAHDHCYYLLLAPKHPPNWLRAENSRRALDETQGMGFWLPAPAWTLSMEGSNREISVRGSRRRKRNIAGRDARDGRDVALIVPS